MSNHNFPRHNAIIEILKRRDLTECEKQKQIQQLNKSFESFYSRKPKK